ncbi:MAG: hypothetical protein K0R28_6300 [Paenibacillus sp.]|jgi:hypothetical protein|nr:hypothetical protein [Paenibacillus sp.]
MTGAILTAIGKVKLASATSEISLRLHMSPLVTAMAYILFWQWLDSLSGGSTYDWQRMGMVLGSV